jgi:isopentenyl diphosphate isomerase/L-lactate dehydrogenase-like FMN-dependent dehydrogenase
MSSDTRSLVAERLINAQDYRERARTLLPKEMFDYIDGAACDELTKRRNQEDLSDILLQPLCLRDVSEVSTSVTLLDDTLPIPLVIGPTGFHRLVHPDGELATIRAAGARSMTATVSAASTVAIEELAKNIGDGRLWQQLYIFKDRELTRSLVRRAESLGVRALIVTIGVPVVGKRERDQRNGFSPKTLMAKGHFGSEDVFSFVTGQLDPKVTWESIEWLQSITTLPIILKGILNPLDAEQACQLGVAAIVVTNHGGRQLDSTISSIRALHRVAGTVRGRTRILLDSGIRRGTDIFKAVALGADAVLIGRPVMWGLACGGQDGVQQLLGMLHKEFFDAMKLMGVRSIDEIQSMGQDLVILPRSW